MDAFVRGRGGAALRLDESDWLETSFGWAHVTSGFEGSGKLLPWSGQGVSSPGTPCRSPLVKRLEQLRRFAILAGPLFA